MSEESKALTRVEDSLVLAVRMEPRELAAILSENIGKALTNPFQLERLSLPTGGGVIWTVPSLDGDEQPVKELTGVLVYKKEGVRTWWKESFEEAGGKRRPPDCFSDDGEYGSSPDVPARMDRVNGRPICATCQYAKWGSSRKGTNAQDCAERSMLFFLPDDRLIPVLIVAPPTSLGRLGKYFLRLSSAPRAYWAVRTGLGLEKVDGVVKYSAIAPRRLADLTPEEAQRIAAYRQLLIPFFEKVAPDEMADASAYEAGLDG